MEGREEFAVTKSSLKGTPVATIDGVGRSANVSQEADTIRVKRASRRDARCAA